MLQLLKSYLIHLLLLTIVINYGCVDPDDYRPEDPPLLPPPDPPHLLLPHPDTTIYTLSGSENVLFDWTTVAGAEIYEIQTDTTLSWSAPAIRMAENPPVNIALYRYAEIATYYVRIRAGSARWTNYTDWSEPRRFFIRLDVALP
ncbi:MAG: hypothetical protein JSW49_10645 [candidate division WOR-3 bacterium]|nr:MAG: hypothetical protein JSW49_10645 [candidate division WOR-3 bacterium]